MSLMDYSNQYAAFSSNSCTKLTVDKWVWWMKWWWPWINGNSLYGCISCTNCMVNNFDHQLAALVDVRTRLGVFVLSRLTTR